MKTTIRFGRAEGLWRRAGGLLCAFVAVAAVAAGTPTEAEAGFYDVRECSSALYPQNVGAPDAAFSNNSAYLAGNGCPFANGLHISHPCCTFSVPSAANWSLAAPPGTVFDSLSFRGVLASHSGHSVQIGMAYADGSSAGFYTTAPGFPGTVPNGLEFGGASVPGSNVKFLGAAIACAPNCNWTGTAAYVGFWELNFNVNDFSAPAVDSLDGSLVASGPRRGTEDLTIQASDEGGGVRETIVRVNGHLVESASNANCSFPNQIANSFRPCSSSAEFGVSVDTEQPPWRAGGANTLEVCALDVAKAGTNPNAGCVTRQVETDNSCEASSAGADQLDAGLERGGQLAPTINVDSGDGVPVRGELRSGGVGVSGASICIYEQVDAPGEPRELVAIAKTKTSGGFGVQLAPGPSREVDAVYRRSNAVLQAPTLRVFSRARPELMLRPKRVANRRPVRFSGSIPGPHANGKAVVLQARAGKKWRTFKQLRTDDQGRFQGKYRFTNTTGHVLYRFRAVVKAQDGYPYEPGPSRQRKVRVNG